MYTYVKAVSEDKVILGTFNKGDLEIEYNDLEDFRKQGNIICGYNNITKGLAIKTEVDLIGMIKSKAKLLGGEEGLKALQKIDFDMVNGRISRKFEVFMSNLKRSVVTETQIDRVSDNRIRVTVFTNDRYIDYAEIVYITWQRHLADYIINNIQYPYTDYLNVDLVYDIDTTNVKVLYTEHYEGLNFVNIVLKYIRSITFTDRCNFKGVVAAPYLFDMGLGIKLQDEEENPVPLDLSNLDFSDMEYYDSMFTKYNGNTDIIPPVKHKTVIKSIYNAFSSFEFNRILGMNTPMGKFLQSIEDITEEVQYAFSYDGFYSVSYGHVDVPVNILRIVQRFADDPKGVNLYKFTNSTRYNPEDLRHLYGSHIRVHIDKTVFNLLTKCGLLDSLIKHKSRIIFKLEMDFETKDEVTGLLSITKAVRDNKDRMILVSRTRK